MVQCKSHDTNVVIKITELRIHRLDLYSYFNRFLLIVPWNIIFCHCNPTDFIAVFSHRKFCCYT